MPEGLPMINTPHANNLWGGVNPVRHSTGSMDFTRGATAAANLSGNLNADFTRMSFEEGAAAGGVPQYPGGAQINPYASAFFSGGPGFGRGQEGSAPSPATAAAPMGGGGAGDYMQQQGGW